MKIEGKIWRDGKWWLIDIPLLDLATQGRSKKEAIEMAGSVVEDIVGQVGFTAKAVTSGGDKFLIESNQPRTLTALMLRRLRLKKGITVREASKGLGSKSPNAFGAYEQGRSAPTLEQLEKLLKAVDPAHDLVLKLA